MTDIDECSVGSFTCDPMADCVNNEGSYDCLCQVRYSGDGKSCDLILIDECTLGLHSCHREAACSDTRESYTCQCNQGWQGDGYTCTDVDECAEGICHTQNFSKQIESSISSFVEMFKCKAILKKLSVGGNISGKKDNRKEGNFYLF